MEVHVTELPVAHSVPIGWYLLATIPFVLLNGFFVAAEFALVKVRSGRSRLGRGFERLGAPGSPDTRSLSCHVTAHDRGRTSTQDVGHPQGRRHGSQHRLSPQDIRHHLQTTHLDHQCGLQRPCEDRGSHDEPESTTHGVSGLS